MNTTFSQAFSKNFLGNAPDWYKIAILIFLLVNPLVFFLSARLWLGGFWLLSSSSPLPWR